MDTRNVMNKIKNNINLSEKNGKKKSINENQLKIHYKVSYLVMDWDTWYIIYIRKYVIRVYPQFPECFPMNDEKYTKFVNV